MWYVVAFCVGILFMPFLRLITDIRERSHGQRLDVLSTERRQMMIREGM